MATVIAEPISPPDLFVRRRGLALDQIFVAAGLLEPDEVVDDEVRERLERIEHLVDWYGQQVAEHFRDWYLAGGTTAQTRRQRRRAPKVEEGPEEAAAPIHVGEALKEEPDNDRGSVRLDKPIRTR